MSANSTSSRDSGPGGPARAPPGPLRDPNRFGGRHSARTGPHPRLGPSAIWPPPPSPGAVRKEAIPPPGKGVSQTLRGLGHKVPVPPLQARHRPKHRPCFGRASPFLHGGFGLRHQGRIHDPPSRTRHPPGTFRHVPDPGRPIHGRVLRPHESPSSLLALENRQELLVVPPVAGLHRRLTPGPEPVPQTETPPFRRTHVRSRTPNTMSKVAPQTSMAWSPRRGMRNREASATPRMLPRVLIP